MPFGKCKITDSYCKPQPTQWQQPQQAFNVNGQGLLLQDACIACKLGGTITATHSGQQ